jgi:hypothetical protein
MNRPPSEQWYDPKHVGEIAYLEEAHAPAQ